MDHSDRRDARSASESDASSGGGSGPPSDPASSTAPASASLGSLAIHGSLWTVGRFGAENVLRLVSNMVLTRLLLPEAFGVMALISAVLAGLAMFADVGISSSVVQNKRGDEETFLNTVWTLQAIRGGVLWLFAILVSPAMASFYGLPELGPLIIATGLTSVISGFNSIALLRMRRHLQLKQLAMIETAGQFMAAAATITWAWFIPSVWALVWGALIGHACKLVISHVATGGYRCRFAWEADARRELIRFGKWIFLSTLLTFLAGQSDRLIFGKLFDVATLGLFAIAILLAAIPTHIVWQIGNLVLFPALSRRSDSAVEFERFYRRTVKPILAFGALPVACLAACAPELVEILYDPRYLEAGWMIQILAVGAWLQVPQASSAAVPLAMGEPRWLAAANALKVVGMIVLLPVGFRLLGPAGAIAGLVGAEFFRYATYAGVVRRFGIPMLNGDVSFSILVVVASLAGIGTSDWIGAQGGGAVLRLLGAVAVIFVIWAGTSLVLLREELPGVRAAVLDALGGSQPSRV